MLAEAMAAGLAIVASDIPGYRDVARDGVEAILVTPDDPAALVAGVARVLDDPVLAKALGGRGAERARQYDWDTVTQQVVATYREVV